MQSVPTWGPAVALRASGVRRLQVAIAGAFALAICVAPAPALAHNGNPNFRSEATQVRPKTPGLSVQVLNYDDRLELTNRSGKSVVVLGYQDEPYVRILADGNVQVNKRSPAYYLNEDRFAEADVPPQADPKATPQWETIDGAGRYDWHDHRIHWMSKSLPRQVTDKDKAAKIFDWKVPIEVGAKRGDIDGTLSWEPSPSGIPLAAIVSFVAIAVVGLGLVLLSNRRRNRPGTPKDEKDAWG